MEETTIRPGRIWYLVYFLIPVIGIAIAGRIMSTSGIEPGHPVRNEGKVTLPTAGSYSVYVIRRASQRMDPPSSNAWNSARDAKVTVRDDRSGELLAVDHIYEKTEIQNTRIARLVEFEVPTPGDYTVAIAPPLTALHPAVRETTSVDAVADELGNFVIRLLVAIAAAGLSVVIGGVMLVITFFRRMKAKQQAAPVA